MGSAEDYIANADRLSERASQMAGSPAAAILHNHAREWRKLAIEADWQDAMRAALDELEATTPPR